MLEALVQPALVGQEDDVRHADRRTDEWRRPRVNFFVEQVPQRVRFQAVDQCVVPGPIRLCHFSSFVHS